MSAQPQPEPTPEPPDEVEASRAPLMDHLIELRTRLIRVLICLVVLFIGAWFITQKGLDLLLVPFSEAALAHGKTNQVVMFTAPMELLFVQLKLGFLLAIAGGFPYIAYQVYAFVAPGLYKKERMAVLPFLFVMPVLFIAGAALVYYSVLPIFIGISFDMEFKGAAAQVSYVPQVTPYYEMAISLLTCFGLAFQLPVVIALLSRAGVIESRNLAKIRKYAYVVIFIVAAIMTPADPFSVWILSIPLCLLYESGIVCAWMIERGRKRREAEEAQREEEEAKREAEAAAKRRAAAANVPTTTAQPGE